MTWAGKEPRRAEPSAGDDLEAQAGREARHDDAGVAWAAVRAGVVADLALLVPAVALYAALHAAGVIRGDTGVIATGVVAGLVAPMSGGAVAARRAPRSPLTTSALAAGIAVAFFAVFRLADAVVRARPVAAGSVVMLVMVGVVLGMVGGVVAARSRSALG